MRYYFPASDIPTVDDWAELSAIGWGTSWAVVGSSLETMVEGSGADREWVQLSDEGWLQRQKRADRAYWQAVRRDRDQRTRSARLRAQLEREQAQAERERYAAANANRLRQLRYELEALKAAQTLRGVSADASLRVEFYGPVAGGREPEWHPINMRLTSEAEALNLAEHFRRVQGIQARAVAW
jgi:hypothetical protein